MADVERIILEIVTASEPGSEPDGAVFLGIGGREFRIKSASEDFKATGQPEWFILGPHTPEQSLEKPLHPAIEHFNNPIRHYSLTEKDVSEFPLYIRFVPTSGDDNWQIARVRAEVPGSADPFHYETFENLTGEEATLWLGDRSGNILYLRWQEPIETE